MDITANIILADDFFTCRPTRAERAGRADWAGLVMLTTPEAVRWQMTIRRTSDRLANQVVGSAFGLGT